MSNPLSPAEMAAVRELTAWEVFEASDGNPSIRLKEGRTTEEQARALVDAIRPIIEAEALHEFADANRFPSDWIMFRRNDGSGVTVPDLLREVAAGKLRAAGWVDAPTIEESGHAE
ncbi:hypothetical protein [Glycomyces paridis]|uniref:Uncharacterized protein n=1 Tax=Glycomyces paridis TaxID=2126555 RepID=A0A4S8P8J1_9ACTN|nr:hypothetical protein [Glycomyces paridis]THV25991.1 hypothetical protein E9998_19855 [Glycomyces paridis]